MQKIVETRSSLSNTIKYTSTIMSNPSLHIPSEGVTHDCASILDSIAKGTSCFHYFLHIPTSPFIQLNDFYTCFITAHADSTYCTSFSLLMLSFIPIVVYI